MGTFCTHYFGIIKMFNFGFYYQTYFFSPLISLATKFVMILTIKPFNRKGIIYLVTKLRIILHFYCYLGLQVSDFEAVTPKVPGPVRFLHNAALKHKLKHLFKF